ncbi:isoprenyl transferase [Endomicrobiia bacterium]|uniref:Isoprenyl transferase n=1 Tax=Endomicrobium trichonymphae TaxID=1408204 RepID=B1H058_ENDTX|nr:isoprenyl transferase [Candidatus Endomicrobium trichonymphae]GHT03853.1 isoprenyl transferase [Endomicrobiia bacterium]BAG13890.1 undecaprenyl diphosphate synthetase [Candidatus Endomicrobium trichonymphae]BAV59031.1 undecaprenyl pyrophosphate synthetase [Candidatus Endomicrobium trichonymphae]GHT09074.1 isoprenyl transferase [Endomicrobiia bacterium]GHT11195.1 isoprenyl transferase [Endomicrobiia bacterium]
MIPGHVAIIMDGNGRWAEKRSLPRTFGHKQGGKTVKKIVKAASNLGIRILTLYAFSTENWKRPQSEIKELFSLIMQFIKEELIELNNCIKLRILGDLSKFPENIRTEIENASKITSQNTGLELNIALNYGARQELIHAFEEMSKQNIKKPTEEIISSFLYTAGQPDPDLLIRTSGEFRISNFLLWQIAYSEIYITDKLWPDFTQQDLETAVSEFQKRERHFGGL